ncbi:N(G),N(G)-dimethylarginine dimethylaminohydrolase [Cryobacterium sp. 1639]|uniref:dimethylargininase n=1 Tax=Cryobacterium inferilacus TaxID=2866629 RepID=UPI001C73A4FA|nr:dimethylargininase [Cryobacterium sp. 1639]MBX0300205.1 N(G),N(G)-dimethylarginine dimethylaminohydrolase [Cryobacterium sp. 1639]
MATSSNSRRPAESTGPTSASLPIRPGRRALVRRPVDSLAEGQITHIERMPIDLDLARAQWDGYVAALEAQGWATTAVEPAPDQPDSVFIEDAVILFGDTAVLSSPGAPSRRGETAGAEAAVRTLGLTVRRIELPGTLDGGDVLKVGTTVYVGQSLRTNTDGAAQLAAIAEPLGYTVLTVPVTRALHLKTAITALPDGTVIGYPPLVDDADRFESFLPVPEAEGTAVVILDERTLLMSAAAPRTTALLTGLGYTVVTVDITEFEKLEGCVTCLSVRVR